MPSIRFSLFLAALSLISLSSTSIAQTPNPSPSDATQPGIDANIPQPTEADRLFQKGTQQLQQGQLQEALQTFQQVLKLRRQAGDRLNESDTISAIAGIYEKQEQYQQALEQYQQALVIVREIKDRSREANALDAIGKVHSTLKQYPQALEVYQQALVIVREIGYRPGEAITLQSIATTHFALQQYAQALEAYQQALPLVRDMRNLFAKDDPNIVVIDTSIGQIHFSIGQIYSTLGQYSESQKYLSQGVELLQKALADARANNNRAMEESTILQNLLGSYEVLGQVYTAQEQYEQAISYLNKAIELARQTKDQEYEKKLFEPLVRNYALQGLAYQAQRDYESALKSFQQALKIAQENGVQYWEASSLLYIGQIYTSRQDFAQALNYQQQAEPIIKQINDRSLQIQLLFNRGSVYQQLSRYPEALKAYQDAHLLLQATGDSLGAASTLLAIGGIYANQKQYDQALNSYRQAQEALQSNPFVPFENGINANNVEEFCTVAQHVGAIEGISSLAGSCTSAYALGVEALKQPFVLDGLNGGLKAQNQVLLTLKGGILHATGQIYLQQKNYSQALASYQQALPILHEAGSSIEGATLGDMGIIYLSQGEYDKALSFSQQAVEISRLLNQRINEEDALYYLAIAYWAKGDVSSALNTLSQKAQVENQSLANNLAIGSEERKRTFLSGQSQSVDITVSFHLQSAPQSSETARLAFTTVLQRKGRILDAVSDNVQRLRQNLQPEDQKLLDDLNTFRAALVNLFYDKQNTLSAEEFKAQVTTLKTKIDELENTLAQRSTEFRAEVQPVTIEAVQALIPADATLVEFVRYSPFNPKANPTTSEVWGTPRYAAAVLTHQGDPKWIDLGEAAPIDQAVRQFRDGLRNQMAKPEVQEKGKVLYSLLMSKVQAEVGTVHHLLISPDSQLNLIPFAALVTPQNQYLVETHTITYLTSGRDLLRLPSENANRPSQQTPVIIANPDFDRPGNSAPAQVTSVPSNGSPPGMSTHKDSQRSADLGTQQFARLAGTQAEAAAIAPLFSNALRLEGSQATENALKQLHSPSILHIATHGFFFGDSLSFTQPTANTALNDENPLLRSGLALAGFNARQSGSEDGVLTALEVTGLDLRGTRLVVLSACDTGFGDILNGEGVYGLRRAFVIAGAESQMVSLWRVDDQVSAELMSKYYQLLKEGRDRSEALRQVQLEMIQSPSYSDPYFWSAFIFSGDWRKMEGF